MKKNYALIFLSAILILSMAIVPVYAWKGGKKGSKSKGNLESKFFWKAKFLLVHKDMLKLSDKQTEEIKDLKIATKKYLIKSKADIEIIAIDIKSNLFYSDKINLKATEELVDQKYKIKKEKAKTLVRSYAKICDILTQDQADIFKSLKLKMKQQSSEYMKCQQTKSRMSMSPMMKAPEAGSK